MAGGDSGGCCIWQRCWRSVDFWMFLALPVLYFLLFGFHGFSDKDHGFLTASSWRILQGQEPYLDFNFSRPPLSAYLHAGVLWLLPDSIGLLGERFLFYCTIWASVCLGITALSRTVNFAELRISPFLCGSLGFILSVNNFSPYPWYTLDGVALGTLGMFFLTRGDRWRDLVPGGAALLAAALCKQSFYPLLFAGIATVALLYGCRSAWKLAGFLVGSVGVGVVAVMIALPDTWVAFRAQTGVGSDFGEALNAGVTRYLNAASVFLPVGAAIWVLRRRRRLRGESPDGLRAPELLIWGSTCALILLNLSEAFEMQRWQKASFGYSQSLYVFALTAALLEFRVHRTRAVSLLALLAVGWCGGISWGTKSPILTSAPIVVGVLMLTRQQWRGTLSPHIYRGLAVVLLALYATLCQFPLYDSPRESCTHALGEVFDKGTGLWVGPCNHKQHVELRDFARQYGSPITVLPGLPLANYFTDTRSPLGVDWASNFEVFGLRDEVSIIRDLEASGGTILIQKSELEYCRRQAARHGRGVHPFGSWLTLHVVTDWKLMEESENLAVYRFE